MSNKLNGLDLFSGIGGLSVGLSEWVKPVAYCEIDRYAAAVLFSRMSDGNLPTAPIFPDVRSLSKEILPSIDIIYGGFPCQDISVAGHGKGLAGERSGLFYEVIRLTKEIKPKFIFLENVPAIASRGGVEVVNQITQIGYDCRWTRLSAANVGANHKRERWWLLAHTDSIGRDYGSNNREGRYVQKASVGKLEEIQQERDERIVGTSQTRSVFSDTGCKQSRGKEKSERTSIYATGCSWWSVEPDVGRVAHGVSNRVDRIKGLGNAVVPLCAKEAFEELIGFAVGSHE